MTSPTTHTAMTTRRPDMTPERWRIIKDVLAELLSCPESERLSRLAEACGEDLELRRQVETFLNPDPRVEEFFENTARGVVTDFPGPYLVPSSGEESRSGGALARMEDGDEDEGDLIGEKVGSFRIEHLLSRGGMGEVYLAEHIGDFRKRVAVKVIRHGMATEELVSWFHNERQILARLEHPNIAQLLDGGTTDRGLPYLVMEYVDGEPIDEYCDAKQLSLDDRLELFLKVCRAVRFAHQKLVIHRDLKPANILITADGTPKIVDFGIARLLRRDPAEQDFYNIANALRVGPLTPDYASPEHVLGFSMSTVSDVYSLGVVLYQLLTGHLPYNVRRHRDMEKVLFRERPQKASRAIDKDTKVCSGGGTIVHATPESVTRNRSTNLKRLRDDLAGDLDSILMKALERDPEQRYASVERLAEDIRRHLGHLPVTAHRQTFLYKARKYVRRNTYPLATAIALVVLLLGSVVTTTILWKRAEADRRQAVQASGLMEQLWLMFSHEHSAGDTLDKKQLLDLSRQQLDEALDDSLRATLAGAIAQGYLSLSEYDAAEELFLRAIELERRIHPGDTPRLVLWLGDLGETYYKLDRNADATPYFREALAIQMRLGGGEDSPELLVTLNNLAASLLQLGQLDEAETTLRRVLDIKAGLRGADALESLVVSRNNLAFVLTQQGRYEEATELYRRGLEDRSTLYPADDERIANSRNSLGVALYTQNALDEAETHLRQALEIRRYRLGDDHADVATSLNNLGLVLHALGARDEAESLFRSALAIRERRLEQHRTLASTRKNLAMALLERRPLDEPTLREAENLLNAALLDFRQKLPEGHWRIADAESVLGACLTALGRTGEARQLLSEAYGALVKSRGSQAIQTVQAEARLTELLRRAT